MAIRIGVDLGGTKIEAVALDAAGTVRARRRVPTPRDDYAATLRAIAGLSVWLNGRPFDRDLVGLMGRPLRFANDANCFALSEARDGAGAGARVVFGVIVGTGTGGGAVVDGRILTGPNAIAGEWGHNPLPWPREGEWPGPACYCGMSQLPRLYRSVPPLLARYAFSDSLATRLVPPIHGDSSGVRGAAWLWALDGLGGR